MLMVQRFGKRPNESYLDNVFSKWSIRKDSGNLSLALTEPTPPG